MKKVITLVTLMLLQMLLFSVMLGGVMALRQDITNGDLVGVKVGDWVKYSVVRLGQPHTWVPPPIERADWVKVDVLDIGGTTVTAKETMHLMDGSERIKTFSGDIRTDFTETYIIAANLSAGDDFLLGSYAKVTMNSTISRTYGEVTREVNLLNKSYLTLQFDQTYNYSEEYYWDKKSGFLLEKTFRSYALGYENTSTSTLSLTIIDTNMWKMNTKPQSLWSQLGPAAVASLLLATVAVMTVATKLSNNSRQRTETHGK